MDAVPLKTCNTCGRKFMNPEDFLRHTTRWRVCAAEHLWFNCACRSTSMIIKGKYDWYNPLKQMSTGAQSIFNSIPSIKNMPRLPSYVMEIQTLIQDENTTASQLSSVAKRDPLLASQILKVANIQVSTRGIRIESLAHAITFIGIKTLQDIVMVAALQTFKLQSKVFNADRFWEHSFVIGRLAEALSKHFQMKFLADEVYIAGSLSNIGKIVLAICLPDIADQYAQELENLSILGNWTDAETRNDGYKHTILGEIGSAFWGLPEHVTEAIADHHALPSLNEREDPSMTEIVALANQMAHWLLLQPHQMDMDLYKALCKRFKLNEQEAEKLIDSLFHLRNFT